MAMNIISKEKKEIRWIGLPTNSRQECEKLEREKKVRLERIKQKRSQLHELILQVRRIGNWFGELSLVGAKMRYGGEKN